MTEIEKSCDDTFTYSNRKIGRGMSFVDTEFVDFFPFKMLFLQIWAGYLLCFST